MRTVADSASVQRSFYEIDVFTTTPYFGNALAVVLDGALGHGIRLLRRTGQNDEDGR